MKRTITLILVATILLVTAGACGQKSPPPTPNTRATVQAAMAGTTTAQANTEATVAAAVQATTAAQTDTQATAAAAATGAAQPNVEATIVAQANAQATIAAAVQATVLALPTATPAAEYVSMSEEELAVLIDQAVTDAAAATEACSTVATGATADDAMTPEEVIMAAVYAELADEAIALAEDLIYIYLDVYGELATETVDTMELALELLLVMAENTESIDDTLLEIYAILEEELPLAEEVITQLETIAQLAGVDAAAVLAQTEDLIQVLQVELETRAATALSAQPNNVATDRQEALRSALGYAEAVKGSLADGKLSASELANVAQLGANAIAGLNAVGGAQLQQLTGSISDLTALIARGQMPQAKASLGKLEASLGSIPSLPSRR